MLYILGVCYADEGSVRLCRAGQPLCGVSVAQRSCLFVYSVKGRACFRFILLPTIAEIVSASGLWGFIR